MCVRALPEITDMPTVNKLYHRTEKSTSSWQPFFLSCDTWDVVVFHVISDRVKTWVGHGQYPGVPAWYCIIQNNGICLFVALSTLWPSSVNFKNLIFRQLKCKILTISVNPLWTGYANGRPTNENVNKIRHYIYIHFKTEIPLFRHVSSIHVWTFKNTESFISIIQSPEQTSTWQIIIIVRERHANE